MNLVLLALGLTAVGCAHDDNSPDMGKVAPKPNPNISAQLPENIREQMQQAKPGSDAEQMSRMKRH